MSKLLSQPAHADPAPDTDMAAAEPQGEMAWAAEVLGLQSDTIDAPGTGPMGIDLQAWLSDGARESEGEGQRLSVVLQHQPDDHEECQPSATVHFETDSAELDGQDIATLVSFADELEGVAGTIELFAEGWADPRGSEAHNADLAERRALAVATFIEEASAFVVGPIQVRSMGEDDDVDLPQGRRVDLWVEGELTCEQVPSEDEGGGFDCCLCTQDVDLTGPYRSSLPYHQAVALAWANTHWVNPDMDNIIKPSMAHWVAAFGARGVSSSDARRLLDEYAGVPVDLGAAGAAALANREVATFQTLCADCAAGGDCQHTDGG